MEIHVEFQEMKSVSVIDVCEGCHCYRWTECHAIAAFIFLKIPRDIVIRVKCSSIPSFPYFVFCRTVEDVSSFIANLIVVKTQVDACLVKIELQNICDRFLMQSEAFAILKRNAYVAFNVSDKCIADTGFCVFLGR